MLNNINGGASDADVGESTTPDIVIGYWYSFNDKFNNFFDSGAHYNMC